MKKDNGYGQTRWQTTTVSFQRARSHSWEPGTQRRRGRSGDSPSDPDRVWAQARGENLVRQSRVSPRFLNYYTVGPEQLFNDAFWNYLFLNVSGNRGQAPPSLMCSFGPEFESADLAFREQEGVQATPRCPSPCCFLFLNSLQDSDLPRHWNESGKHT